MVQRFQKIVREVSESTTTSKETKSMRKTIVYQSSESGKFCKIFLKNYCTKIRRNQSDYNV